MNLQPVEVLKQVREMLQGTRAGRVLPWATLTAGVGAAAAIILRLFPNPQTAVFGVIGMFALMAVAIVFPTLVTKGGPAKQFLVIVFAFAVFLLMIASLFFLMTGFFFGWPRPLVPQEIREPQPIEPVDLSLKWQHIGEITEFGAARQDENFPDYTQWSFHLDLNRGSENPFPLMLEFTIRPEAVGDYELGKPEARIAGKLQNVGYYRPFDQGLAAKLRRLLFTDEVMHPRATYEITLWLKPTHSTKQIPEECLANPTKLVVVTRNRKA